MFNFNRGIGFIGFLFPLFLITFTGCSSSDITNPTNNKKRSLDSLSSANYKTAMEKVIDGAAAESKGDFATAILEYQDALLNYPSAGIYFSLAKNYYYLNKLSLAMQNGRKAVEMDNNNIDYLRLLQEIYSTSKMGDSAITVLNNIIRIDSSDADAYYKLGGLLEITRPAQAITVYEKLLDLIGNEWNVLLRIAELNERLGNVNNAIDRIRDMAALDPGNIQLQKFLVDYYLKGKQKDNALNLIDELLLQYPDDFDLIEKKAQIFIEDNDWKQASDLYSKILEHPGTSFDIKIKIGAAYFNASLKDSTLLDYAESLFVKMDKDTLDWQVKMYLGAIATNKRQDSVAMKNFEVVTELAPWNPEAWIRLGGLYFDNKRYKDVITVLGKAYAKFPEEFVINLLLGISYAQENNHQEAKGYLKKAVTLNQTDINALSAYGYTLNQLNEPEQAITYIIKALNLDPGNVDLMGTLGLIYDDQEKWQECDSIYEAALKVDSLSAIVNNNYAYSLSKRAIKLDYALQMVTIALEKEPNNSSYLDTKGWVYYMIGDYEQARIFIEKSLAVNGNSAVVFDHLGDVYFKLGNNPKAIETWQKAFDLDKTKTEIKQKIERGSL